MRSHRSNNNQSQQTNRQQAAARTHSRRGFASMDPEEHRRISSLGGQHSHNRDRQQHNQWEQDERYSMGTQRPKDYQGSSRGSYFDQNQSYQDQQSYGRGYDNDQRDNYQSSLGYSDGGNRTQSRFSGSSLEEPQRYNESSGYNDNYRLQDDAYLRQGNQYGQWQEGPRGSRGYMDRDQNYAGNQYRGERSGQDRYDQSFGNDYSLNERGGYRDSNGYQGSRNSYDSDRNPPRGYSSQEQNMDRNMNRGLNYNNNDEDYLDNYQSRNGRSRY